MEIELNSSLIERIALDEAIRARDELAQHGPVAALTHSQRRHDARLATAPDAHTLACKNGCYWCCYFTVEARAAEVIRIVQYMHEQMPAAERERIEAEIRTHSAILTLLDEEARLRHNLKCPFLRFGRCSIYPVRPQTCRNYHATAAAGCEQAFREPDNDDIDPEFAPLVYQIGGAHAEAFTAATQAAGYDVAVYELNAALDIALADPGAACERFESGRRTFPTLAGREVEPEFVRIDMTQS